MQDIALSDLIISSILQKRGRVRKDIRRVLRLLLEFLGDLGTTLIGASTDDFRRFCDHRTSLGRSVRITVWAMGLIDGVLVDAGLIAENRARQLRRRKPRPLPGEVDIGLVNTVIAYHEQKVVETPRAAIIKIRLLAILHLSADIGTLRPEIAALEIRDFQRLDRGEILLGRGTSRERTRWSAGPCLRALSAFMEYRLRSAPKSDDRAFVTTGSDARGLSSAHITQILDGAISSAGLGESCLTPGSFTQSIVAQIVDAGHGWQNARTTLGYKCIPLAASKRPAMVDLAQLIATYHPLR
jgi:site-specific recombinase XerD